MTYISSGIRRVERHLWIHEVPLNPGRGNDKDRTIAYRDTNSDAWCLETANTERCRIRLFSLHEALIASLRALLSQESCPAFDKVSMKLEFEVKVKRSGGLSRYEEISGRIGGFYIAGRPPQPMESSDDVDLADRHIVTHDAKQDERPMCLPIMSRWKKDINILLTFFDRTGSSFAV